MLLLDREGPVVPTPLPDPGDGSRKSPFGRFAKDHPFPLPAATPVVREAQEVEGHGQLSVSIPSDAPRWSLETHQSIFLGMQG
jgi:hypothetical protein